MLLIDSEIARQTRKAQQRIFRLANFEHGLNRKVIAADSGMPYSTLAGYADGSVIMPITAVVRLIGVIPDELLSQLFEPADRHLVKNDDDDSCLDDLGERADAVAQEVRRARHPNSPGGTEIVAVEEAKIKLVARGLRRAA